MSIQSINGTMNPMGHLVKLETDHPLHYDGSKKVQRAKDDIGGSFHDTLMNLVGNVNDLQVDSENLVQKMIYDPESVDVHSVMIAQQKAEIALTLTKTVRDEALKSYRELVNLR